MRSFGLMIFALLFSAVASAHDGDTESRAMRMLGLLQQMDKSWSTLQRETEPARRTALLDAHARTLLEVQEALRDAADKSPCVMMETQDATRQLACLVDTEARLRASERVLGHLINRMAITTTTTTNSAGK